MFVLSHLLAAAVVLMPGTPRPAATIVTIQANDYSFVAPKSVKANGPITFRLVNKGKELHHVSIIKLAKGKTMKDVGEVLKKKGPPPAWMTDVGGPNPAVPGGTAEATLVLEPGEYALLCFIPTPGTQMPHIAKGMVGSMTVTPGDAGVQQAGELKGDVTMRTSEYKFTLSRPLTAGKQTIRFVNDGVQTHEVVMVRLAPGKTLADLNKWMNVDLMKGPPPGETVGGMAGMAKGRDGLFPVDLKPGNHVLLCFVPDAKDGKGHDAHGMVQQLVVK